jgi:hypothetical protein
MSKLRDNIEQVTKRIPWDGLWDFTAYFRLSISKRVLDEEIRSGDHRDINEEEVIDALENKIIEMTADENGITDRDRMRALEAAGVQFEVFGNGYRHNVKQKLDEIILAQRNKRT